MSVNTEGTENTTEQTAPVDPTTPPANRQHVEAGELSNGGLELPAGEAKSDEKEAEREEHKEWHPDSSDQ